jgi:hypothetical protein
MNALLARHIGIKNDDSNFALTHEETAQGIEVTKQG